MRSLWKFFNDQRGRAQPIEKQAGFTLVELNISLIVTGVLMIGVVGSFLNYFVVVTRTNLTIDMTVDSQNFLRTVTEELRYGAGVRTSNVNDDPSIGGPSGEWSTGNTNFVIITTVAAVDTNGNYIIDLLGTGEPYINELVYYKSDSKVYKRILGAKCNISPCDADGYVVGNTLKTSCPESLATPSCPADRMLIESVDSVGFVLYDQDNVDITSTPPANWSQARSITINLNLERDTFGAPLTYSNSIRMTLRNTFQ